MKITPKQYAQLINQLLLLDQPSRQEAKELLGKIAGLVKRNGDEKKLERIFRELDLLTQKENQELKVKVTAASKLEKAELEKIKQTIAKKKGLAVDKVELEQLVDEEVKDGFVFDLGGEIWDMSLKAKLSKLKSALVG